MAFRRSAVRSRSAPPIKSRLFWFRTASDSAIVRKVVRIVKCCCMPKSCRNLSPTKSPYESMRWRSHRTSPFCPEAAHCGGGSSRLSGPQAYNHREVKSRGVCGIHRRSGTNGTGEDQGQLRGGRRRDGSYHQRQFDHHAARWNSGQSHGEVRRGAQGTEHLGARTAGR